ncbi:MAG: hypothetical protein BMS9Abin29_1207 [Gemmatimonadota bacterium]|nr:MAG: hypothetical protein BMS9Abin29_1207 [Gemmatimonadota bacterium]
MGSLRRITGRRRSSESGRSLSYEIIIPWSVADDAKVDNRRTDGVFADRRGEDKPGA